MHVTAREPVGAELTDVDLHDLTDDDVDDLRGLLATHGVLVVRDHPIDDEPFAAFLRRFGPLAFTAGETPVPGHPDLNLITNVGRERPPRSQFHVDTSYVPAPPAYTSLRAVRVPAEGGETLFSNQYRAYETLDPAVRERLAGRWVEHREGDDAARHPLFRPHPVSGRTALYLSTAGRCVAVEGMTPEESAEVVAALLAHSTRADNVHRHRWATGDVVVWDNGCVMHRADHSAVVGDRVMHRGMSLGYAA